MASGLVQEFAGPIPKRFAPQDQPLAKIVPRGRDHLSKRLIDLPPVFLLGGTPRAAEIAEPVEAQPGRGSHARHCRIGWVAAPPVGTWIGKDLATDAGVLSADENVFPAGTGLEHVRKSAYYFLHEYRRQTTSKH